MQTKTTPTNIKCTSTGPLYRYIQEAWNMLKFMDKHKKLCHGKMNTENFATLLGDCFKSALL